MNFGIIGFGNIARRFAEGIEADDEGRIAAIASRSLSTDDPYLAANTMRICCKIRRSMQFISL